MLESGELRLEVAPSVGAGAVGLWARAGGGWQALSRETPAGAVEAGNSSALASFVLAPYSNRIRNARFAFGGREHRLVPNTPEGNAQHGDVRRRPWRVLQRDPQGLRCAIDSRDFADFNFPWPIAVEVEYRLHGNHQVTRLRLENAGTKPMPAGLGLHPYFRRRVAGASEDLLLAFRAGGVYETGPDLIPAAGAVPVPPELDFAHARPVTGLSLNHVYAGWDGRATLSWPGAGLALELQADPVFSHVVAFTAPDGSVAVEPVTNATDGFNLMARGIEGSGVRVLEPGEALEGEVRLTLAHAL